MACTGTDITDRGTMYIGVIYFGVCTGTDITGRDMPCIYRCCIFLGYVQGQTLQVEIYRVYIGVVYFCGMYRDRHYR